jgi:predicted nucleic acid-binding protein
MAAEIRRKYKTKSLDILIAAISVYLDAQLFTFNLKDLRK